MRTAFANVEPSYLVLTAKHLQVLEKIVSTHLAKGYDPCGGITTIKHDIHSLDVTFAQAVYKPQK